MSSTTTGATPVPTTTVDNTDPSAVSGVPCDVAQVLAKSCAGCHGPAPTGGAPNAMMTYDELMTTSASAPTKSVAELSLARMKDTKSPMPPEGAAAEDVAVIEKWIAAGMPAGDVACDATPASTDLYGTPSACTSGTTWTRGNRGSSAMKPGAACNDCHRFTAAGTVYATAHEPDDCNGSSVASIKVVITGADGMVTTLPVNSAGNFSLSSSIKLPYKARVVSGTKSRAMSGAQTDGDCNRCHTENGTEKAPGRVMAP